MTKKSKSPPSAPRSPIQRLRSLFPTWKNLLIVASIPLAIWVGYSGYHSYELSQEEARVMGLKRDMQELQSKLNEQVPGWEYFEGCEGRGAVFEQSVPNYCMITLKNTLSITVFESHHKKISSTLLSTNAQFVSEETLESYTTMKFQNISDPNATCFLSSRIDTRAAINIYCSTDVQQFYFKRYD